MGILQILRLEFQKFRILEILNFHPCLLSNGIFQNYDLQSPIKGRAVIVKNVIYDDETNMQKRNNAEWDAYRLHDVLKKLRFDVKMYVNQTYEVSVSLIREVQCVVS